MKWCVCVCMWLKTQTAERMENWKTKKENKMTNSNKNTVFFNVRQEEKERYECKGIDGTVMASIKMSQELHLPLARPNASLLFDG